MPRTLRYARDCERHFPSFDQFEGEQLRVSVLYRLSEHNYHASIVIPWLFSCLGERHWARWDASSYIKVKNLSNLFFCSSHWLSLYFEVKLKSSWEDSAWFIPKIRLESCRPLYKSSLSIFVYPLHSLSACLPVGVTELLPESLYPKPYTPCFYQFLLCPPSYRPWSGREQESMPDQAWKNGMQHPKDPPLPPHLPKPTTSNY